MKVFLMMAGLAAMGFAMPAHAARELPKAEVMAVYFYADWCGNCKLLSPVLDNVRAQEKLDTRNVLFVTLDLSDKPRIHQSILLAQALGIGAFLKAQGSATGYVAVLDAKTKKELVQFDVRDTEEEIASYFNGLMNK